MGVKALVMMITFEFDSKNRSYCEGIISQLEGRILGNVKRMKKMERIEVRRED